MLNLISRPIHSDTLDAWAKWLEDIAKVAVVAVPVIVFGQYSIIFKLFNSLALIIAAYFCMLGGKLIRQHKSILASLGGN